MPEIHGSCAYADAAPRVAAHEVSGDVLGSSRPMRSAPPRDHADVVGRGGEQCRAKRQWYPVVPHARGYSDDGRGRIGAPAASPGGPGSAMAATAGPGRPLSDRAPDGRRADACSLPHEPTAHGLHDEVRHLAIGPARRRLPARQPLDARVRRAGLVSEFGDGAGGAVQDAVGRFARERDCHVGDQHARRVESRGVWNPACGTRIRDTVASTRQRPSAAARWPDSESSAHRLAQTSASSGCTGA